MDIVADNIFSVFSYVFDKCTDILDMFALHFSSFYVSLLSLLLASVAIVCIFLFISKLVHAFNS